MFFSKAVMGENPPPCTEDAECESGGRRGAHECFSCAVAAMSDLLVVNSQFTAETFCRTFPSLRYEDASASG